MPITNIDAAVLGVSDVADARRFYSDFGLSEVERSGAGANFRTLDASEVLVRQASDPGLPPAVAGGSTIREIVWGVESVQDLAAIAAELSKDRPLTQDADGTLHSVDEDGYGIAFRVARRQPFPTPAPRLNIYGAPPARPLNTRFDFLEAIRPASMAHIVLFTTDAAKAQAFYVDRLKFRITDRFHDGKSGRAHGFFLRSQGYGYHHNLFLIQGANRGLHHIAFPVTDFQDVVWGGKRIRERGWEPKMGPGRHLIGSNFFWYFNSPCGGAMELTADIDRADDHWIAQDWEFKPENTTAWSVTFNA